MQNSKKNMGFNFLNIIPIIAIIILVLTIAMITSMKNKIAENKLNDNNTNNEVVEVESNDEIEDKVKTENETVISNDNSDLNYIENEKEAN